MTPSAALPMVELSRFGWRDIGLWAGAALLVLGAHVAVAYAVQSFSLVDESDGGPQPAQVIEKPPGDSETLPESASKLRRTSISTWHRTLPRSQRKRRRSTLRPECS